MLSNGSPLPNSIVAVGYCPVRPKLVTQTNPLTSLINSSFRDGWLQYTGNKPRVKGRRSPIFRSVELFGRSFDYQVNLRDIRLQVFRHFFRDSIYVHILV